jgi:hypothetical protein
MAGVKQRLKLARQTVGVRAALALVVVAAAVIVVAHRLPAALDGLRDARAADVGRNEAGGALAAADGAQIDDDFVRAAIATVRPPERYAVLYPSIEVAQATYHVSPLTLQVLPMLMREVLLPARDLATPSRGTYLLCYLCDTSPWDHRTRWLWNSDRGIAIGKVYR